MPMKSHRPMGSGKLSSVSGPALEGASGRRHSAKDGF